MLVARVHDWGNGRPRWLRLRGRFAFWEHQPGRLIVTLFGARTAHYAAPAPRLSRHFQWETGGGALLRRITRAACYS